MIGEILLNSVLFLISCRRAYFHKSIKVTADRQYYQKTVVIKFKLDLTGLFYTLVVTLSFVTSEKQSFRGQQNFNLVT